MSCKTNLYKCAEYNFFKYNAVSSNETTTYFLKKQGYSKYSVNPSKDKAFIFGDVQFA